ncbi:MAG: TonB-dependent receptor [Paludibacter sp.]|nr:TonB-dependent receptor [Paludibacter sp.]
MQKHYLYILTFCCFWISFPVHAFTIRGIVTDKETGKPVSNFTVIDTKNHLSALTNTSGTFELAVKKGGNIQLDCSHVSYKSFSLSLGKIKQDTIIYLEAENKITELTDVQITAPLRRQVLTQSYSQTNIDEMVIEEKIATSLIDILEEVPGITKRSEYHSPIALRGLGGKRLLITEDGNRRMGNFSGSFMGQGVNIYDLAKVEVIKGPASVKYGPGAITGIINIKSKSPFLQPGWHSRAMTSYGANNNEKAALASVNWADMDHALSISARWRDANNYTAGKGIEAENSEYHDRDTRVSYTWEGNSSLSINAESELHLGGPWGRPVGFNGTQYMRVYNTDDDTWHSAVTLKWQPEIRLKRMEGSIYFDKEYRQQIKDSYDVGSGDLSYREDVKYNNYYGGWRCLSVFTLNKNTELNLGTDGVYYRIQSPTEYTDYFLTTTIKNRISKDAGVMLAGIFAESEYKLTDGKLKIRAGLRADYSNINEGEVHDTLLTTGRNSDVFAWNGTAGTVYEVCPGMFASLQIARSCRMPDASEMFIVNSTTDGIVYGNPDLTPEHGLNFDTGFRESVGWMSFDLSLFCNFLHDFISMEYWNNSGKKGINYTYYNIDRARIFGGEFSLGTKWKSFLHPDNTLIYNGMFVYTQGDKLTDAPGWFSTGVPLRTIPPFNFKQEVTLRRLINSAMSFYLGGDIRFYATQYRIAPSADGGYISPGYTLFGAAAGFNHRGRAFDWELKLRGDNLADNKYRPFESLVYAMGRNVKVMLTIKF